MRRFIFTEALVNGETTQEGSSLFKPTYKYELISQLTIWLKHLIYHWVTLFLSMSTILDIF
jgi:hypothetical protein